MKRTTILLHGLCALLTVAGWLLCVETGHRLIQENKRSKED